MRQAGLAVNNVATPQWILVSEVGGMSSELWLGLDTGGTYTDAVLLQAGGGVLCSAKALTTREDLAIGLGGAIRAILDKIPAGHTRADVRLVSVSTTLATNAVVEKRFSPICSILVGFDEAMANRSGLRASEDSSPVECIAGGHTAVGDEQAALDEHAVRAIIAKHDHRVEAYAVAASFSVRNPSHELRVRQIVREITHKPVTCAHELTSKLDAPRRALTAALNARLTPQIRHLVEAVSAVLDAESIKAPLMVVKGDGSLMRSDVALDCPVETILSGPAASVVGAGFLTGLSDFLVSDMGGTTTDVAVVTNGRPVINSEGALVGGWRTMVEAVDVHTHGLGGDSEIRLDRAGNLLIGPRRAMPLSLLVKQWPATLDKLRHQASLERYPERSGQFVVRSREKGASDTLSPAHRAVWDSLGDEPQLASSLITSTAALRTLESLADLGLVLFAAFTPSDAMHLLGLQNDWNVEAALCGAQILVKEERNIRRYLTAASVEDLCARVRESVVRRSGRVVLEAALAQDPGLQNLGQGFGPLGDRLLDDTVSGKRFSTLLSAGLGLDRALVAIGAPVSSYYPEVAQRLGSPLAIPDFAAVCNAVGAVAGTVSQTVDILINQPTFKVFRVHDPAALKSFENYELALAHARQVAEALAMNAALKAGASAPRVEVEVLEKRAHNGDEIYVAEATVRATATGRPLAALGVSG